MPTTATRIDVDDTAAVVISGASLTTNRTTNGLQGWSGIQDVVIRVLEGTVYIGGSDVTAWALVDEAAATDGMTWTADDPPLALRVVADLYATCADGETAQVSVLASWA